MKYKYESEALQVMHEEWLDMHRSGYVSDDEMREFEEICFGEEDTGPEAGNSPKQDNDPRSTQEKDRARQVH